ncbi:predicted protein, partial [Nematostella vectensis]
IISGSDAQPNSWPWMVQINYNNGHHCGGTLVSPQWVVTAAHCVDHVKDPKNYNELAITLGEHKRSASEGTEQRFSVARIIVHPQYFEPTAINNDIALIKLNKPARLNKYVNLACLPRQGEELSDGKICYATGWGLTVGGDWKSQSDVLKQTPLPVVNRQECQTDYDDIPITTAMMCTGYGGRSSISTCNTDSGGPVVCKSKLGHWYLQGVVSFGARACAPGHYSVNAKVSKFVTWINQYI